MTAHPTLIVISGPPGAGKSTLAHLLARRLGCPAICRDEIKEGMVHATGPFDAAPSDELSLRTLPTFFGVLNLLLSAGVTTVAEAAFQDKLWRPGLQPLTTQADLRIVHCHTSPEVAWHRIQRRRAEDPLRRAHPDSHLTGPTTDFDRVSLSAPAIEVDTTDGYHPTLDEIVAFINGR